ncbi:MAG: hypothetical protein NTW79_01900 [Candidatus Berkelbacteria bacterium]|nr:hypothetical protein [Candidatus Berkelbacteria bacterium]
MLNSPIDFQTLFLDMNSFFASVEQQVQPKLRGVPVGVAPYIGGSGCIIAASREAKLAGIKTGSLVREAKKIYPKIKIIESRPALYLIYHKEIKKVIESFSPYFQPLSIDEFIIHLTPREQNFATAMKLGADIKDKIRENVGDFLTSSVGIGPSRFLAKMAGERKKPDGLTIVKLSGLEKFYADLKLTDLTGINHQLEFRLGSFGINSPLDFFQADIPRLRQILGHAGRLWFYRLRGFEVDNVQSPTKTVGHSHVLAPEFRNRAGAEAVIRKLIYKAASRLRAGKFLAAGISVSVSFHDASGFHQSKKVPPFSDTKSFIDHVFEILKNCRWCSGCHCEERSNLDFKRLPRAEKNIGSRNDNARPLTPSYVSVSAFNLSSSHEIQLSIFKDIEKSRQISEAMDKIDDQFGVGFVHPASVFSAKDSAPDRIPFGKPRYEIRH